MDVFASCIAPGVSAPQINGLYPWQVSTLLEAIVSSNKLISLDIAELSPALDSNQQTAKLAAQMLATLILCLLNGAKHFSL